LIIKEAKMGWTGIHKDKGTSAKQFITKLYTGIADDGTEFSVRDCSFVGFECYLAVEVYNRKATSNQRYVVGEVVLVQYLNDNYFNFRYKQMPETSHPYYYNAPKRIMDLLSPVEECGYSTAGAQSAIKWRNSVANAEKRRTAIKAILRGIKFRVGSSGPRSEYTYRTDGNITVEYAGWPDEGCLGSYPRKKLKAFLDKQDELYIYANNEWQLV